MTGLEDLNHFLSIVVPRDAKGMILSQRKYALEILDRANILNCEPAHTPALTTTKLDPIGHPINDPTLY